jgi:hypothetical protein
LPARLIWKLSMDIAERKGSDLRRRLRSAERLSDSAICLGVLFVKTPFSRSSALLVCITRRDHRRFALAVRAALARLVRRRFETAKARSVVAAQVAARFARVRAAFLAASDRPATPLVRAAFRAAADRCTRVRRAAAECACLARAR